jgi:hypothetical protein
VLVELDRVRIRERYSIRDFFNTLASSPVGVHKISLVDVDDGVLTRL